MCNLRITLIDTIELSPRFKSVSLMAFNFPSISIEVMLLFSILPKQYLNRGASICRKEEELSDLVITDAYSCIDGGELEEEIRCVAVLMGDATFEICRCLHFTMMYAKPNHPYLRR